MLLVLGWAMLRSLITEFTLGLGLILGMLGLIMLVLEAAFVLAAFALGPLISWAVSRRREFLADASGVELTRFPYGWFAALLGSRPPLAERIHRLRQIGRGF